MEVVVKKRRSRGRPKKAAEVIDVTEESKTITELKASTTEGENNESRSEESSSESPSEESSSESRSEASPEESSSESRSEVVGKVPGKRRRKSVSSDQEKESGSEEINEVLAQPAPQAIAIPHKERAHYGNGGSSMDRREACRASLQAERLAEKLGLEQQENPEAKEGTEVHECIEALLPFYLTETKESDTEVIKGLKDRELIATTEKYPLGHRLITVVEYLITTGKVEDRITAAIKACNNIVDIITPERVGKIAYKLETKRIRDAELELGGTDDVTIAYQEEGKLIAHIWDYKNGRIPKNARETKQLLTYATNLQHNRKEEGKPLFDIIHTHIFQPNSLNHDDGEGFDRNTLPEVLRDTHGYSTKSYTKEEVEEADKHFVIVAQETLGPLTADSFNVTKECAYCGYLTHCPEYKKETIDKLPVAINLTEISEAVQSSVQGDDKEVILNVLPDAEELINNATDAQLLSYLALIPYLNYLEKAVYKILHQRINSGHEIPGLEIKIGRSSRKWNDTIAKESIASKLKQAGITQPYSENLKGLGDIEAELRQLEYEKQDIATFMAAFTVKPEGKKNLVLSKELNKIQEVIGRNIKESSPKKFDPTTVFSSWEQPSE